MERSCQGLFPGPRSHKLPTLEVPRSGSKHRSSPEAKAAAGKLSFLGRRGIWAALPFLPGGCILNPLHGCPPRDQAFPLMDGPGGWGWGLECVWAGRCRSVRKTPPYSHPAPCRVPGELSPQSLLCSGLVTLSNPRKVGSDPSNRI